jgi:hypothetical protein
VPSGNAVALGRHDWVETKVKPPGAAR